jgi:hypothetical protein
MLFKIFFLLSYDLWSPVARDAAFTRSSLIGYCVVGGICSPSRYSIIEDFSFNSISVCFVYYLISIFLNIMILGGSS